MNSPILGLDIGLRRTGVAISESGLFAQPLTVIEWSFPHVQSLATPLAELIRRHDIKTIVVGVPLQEDGGDSKQAKQTDQIIQQLETIFKRDQLELTFIKINEFNSSQNADLLYPETNRDAAAATLILQDHLEQNGQSW